MRARGIRSRPSAAVFLFVLVAQAPNAASGQLVTPRTVPVQQSGQFDVFPSQRTGMAGVSLALDDTLLDPFANPAKLTRLRGVRFISELSGHSVSRGGGGGQTFPLGAFASLGSWSAGAFVAIQDLSADVVKNLVSGEHRAKNHYTSLLLSRRFANGMSVGASGFRATLEGLDGLGALYAGSDSVGMAGEMTDVRAGVMKEWANGRSAELVLLHNRNDISHDVRFPVRNWDPTTRSFVLVNQFEHNEDRGRVLGAHAEFVTRLRTNDSTRFGWIATVNRITHPKIPNYRFSNLPRDPGTTYAFNLGAGLGHVAHNSSFGLDVVYEPIFSHTWAEAGPGVTNEDGTPIAPDTKTVENRFRFSNLKLAAGLSRNFRSASDTAVTIGFQLGLVANHTRYRLRQQDNLVESVRHQRVGFTEWGPTLGVHARIHAVRVAYSFRLMCSPGACEIASGDDVVVSPDAPGVIASPTANLGFDYGQTVVQKLSVTIPMRGW